MPRTISIGAQDFEYLISNNLFYIDKTALIKEWWERADSVTLITRPRRFGKTLNVNMPDRFFSVSYENQAGLFEVIYFVQKGFDYGLFGKCEEVCPQHILIRTSL